MSRYVSLIVLVLLAAALGLAFLQVIRPFLLPLFLSAVMAIVFQPVYGHFLRRCGQRRALAAGLTTAVILALLLLPIAVGTFLGGVQLYVWAMDTIGSPQWQQGVTQVKDWLATHDLQQEWQKLFPPAVSAQSPPNQLDEHIRGAALEVAKRTIGMAQSTFGALGAVLSAFLLLGTGIVSLFYFFADGPVLLAATEALIPVDAQYQRQIREQFVRVTQAVIAGTFAAALAQGVATGLALWVCGFEQAILLTILATVCAVIPLAGTWFVWGPCAAWLAWHGSWGAAIALTLWGVLVVGTLDNIVRAYILNSDVKLHPLLAFISVLGGLQWLGFWGLFVGPIVASCLHAVAQILNTEIQALGRPPATATALTPPVLPAPLATPPIASPPVAATAPLPNGPTVTAKPATAGGKRRKRR